MSIDTLNRSSLRVFDPTAAPEPNLDSFAAEAFRFENALTTASWTLPAHASLMTGLYPDRHGATDLRVSLAEGVETLAEVLRSGGYETIGITDGGLVSAEYGFARGFERYEDHEASRPSRSAEFDKTAVQLRANRLDRAIAFVKHRERKDRPLFLFVHTYAVHDYYEMGDLGPEPNRGANDTATADKFASCLIGKRQCGSDSWNQLRRLYRAAVTQVDRDIGRLLHALATAGFERSAIVVVLSDHGEGFDPKRGRLHHGGRLDEDLIRIPLLIRVPGIRGRNIGTMASLVDVAPTVLDLVGLRSQLVNVDGRSLAPLIGQGTAVPPRTLFAMEHYWQWEGGTRVEPPSVQSEPFETAAVDEQYWYTRSRCSEQLFDVAIDPKHRRNIADGSKDLERWRGAVIGQLRKRPETKLADRSASLSNQLRSLGYVHGDATVGSSSTEAMDVQASEQLRGANQDVPLEICVPSEHR